MVWLCHGCSVATFISSRGESRRDLWAIFCPSWMVGVALSVSDGSDIRLVGHCKGKSHGPRFSIGSGKCLHQLGRKRVFGKACTVN